MCTVPIIRLLPQYEKVKGARVSRNDEWRNFRPYNIDWILPQYKEVKGDGVGILRRDNCRDLQYRPNFQHYNIHWIYGAQLTHRTTMPGKFFPQSPMVSSRHLVLCILLFVRMVVCIFASMYYNIAVVCLCRREVCWGSISCRHVERQPQLTPTKQVCNKCLASIDTRCKN